MLGAARDTQRLDTSMGKLQKTASRVGTAVAAYFTFGAIRNFGTQILNALKNYEYFSSSLRTLMYGDATAAKALEQRLVKLAATTPFSLTDVQAGTKQMLAYGFQPGDVTKDMKMLGDIASGVTVPLGDIVYLYGTLKTQGRAYSRDILQFTNRGIPIIKELAIQFGVGEDKIKDLVEQGKVGFPDIERAFKRMTGAGGQFSGMMDQMSKTVGGRLSNLGDSWEQLMVNIGKSQTGIINSTVSFVAGVVERLNNITAATNRLNEAFTKAGVSGYTFMEKLNNILFMGSDSDFANMFTGGMGKMEKFERSLQGMYVNPSGRDEKQGLQSLEKLKNLQTNYRKAFDKGDMGALEFKRGSALIVGAIEQVEGNLRLLRTKGQTTDQGKGELGTPGAASIGSATEVSGTRPQNLNINIEKFGVIERLEVAQLKDAAREVQDDWSKKLLEVLNDANLVSDR